MWLSYLVARLAANGALGYSMFTTASHRVFDLAPGVLLMHGCMFIMAQSAYRGAGCVPTRCHATHPTHPCTRAALNSMWFYKITLGLIKSLTGGGKKTGAAAASDGAPVTDAPMDGATTSSAAASDPHVTSGASAVPAAPAPSTSDKDAGAAPLAAPTADGSDAASAGGPTSGGGLRRRHVGGSADDAAAATTAAAAPTSSGSGGGGSGGSRHQTTAAVLHTASYGNRRFLNRHDPTSDDFVREVSRNGRGRRGRGGGRGESRAPRRSTIPPVRPTDGSTALLQLSAPTPPSADLLPRSHSPSLSSPSCPLCATRHPTVDCAPR
jgi:hypothetical protein